MEKGSEIIDGLLNTIGILTEFIREIPEDKLLARRCPDCWTIAEHAVHLATVQPVMYGRLERLLHEDNPTLVPFIPSEQPETKVPGKAEVDAALADFKTWREKQVTLLRGVGDAGWERPGVHPECERYTLWIFARHMFMHDYWHMYRMEELWLIRDDHFKG